WRRRRCRRDAARGAQRNDLLLHARLVAELHRVKPFRLPRLVRRVDAALPTAPQRLGAILERRAQQRRGVELDGFVRLALELKQQAERFLDMVERKAES